MKFFYIVFGLILWAAGLWVISISESSYTTTFGVVLIGTALLIESYAAYVAISETYRANLEAVYSTSDIRLIEALQNSNSEIRELAKLHLTASLRIWPWAGGWVTTIGWTKVPRGFAGEFLLKSDNTNLAAIGKWSEGALWTEPGYKQDFGPCRDLAKELTDFLLDIGAAKRSFGNNPARWVDGMSPHVLKVAWGISPNLRNMAAPETQHPAQAFDFVEVEMEPA